MTTTATVKMALMNQVKSEPMGEWLCVYQCYQTVTHHCDLCTVNNFCLWENNTLLGLILYCCLEPLQRFFVIQFTKSSPSVVLVSPV